MLFNRKVPGNLYSAQWTHSSRFARKLLYSGICSLRQSIHCNRSWSCDKNTFRGNFQPLYFCRLTYSSLIFFQLTTRPWILVPGARKTLIWHFDFIFLLLPLHASRLGGSHGGGELCPPFPKFLDPPLPPPLLLEIQDLPRKSIPPRWDGTAQPLQRDAGRVHDHCWYASCIDPVVVSQTLWWLPTNVLQHPLLGRLWRHRI